MIAFSRTLLAAALLSVALFSPAFGLVTINLTVGDIRDAGGSLITDTATLWAVVYDDNNDGNFPGGVGTDDSLATGDAAAAAAAFAGKTITEGTMVDGDRIIAKGEFNSPAPFALALIPLVFDLTALNLTPGRKFAFYWFPGRNLAANTIPASGSFDIGGIQEVTINSPEGMTIPSNTATTSATAADATHGGTLPISRLTAITAEEADFASWIAGFPAVGSEDEFDDDPDGDDLDNGVEAALGTRPDTPNQGVTVLSATSGLTAQSSQAKPSLADVDAEWEWSHNLTSWFASDASNGSATVTINESVTDPSDPNFDVTQVDATVTFGQLDKLFLRLNVTQIP